ncbi:MAG: O-antigen ligase family protein [Patescibacteria group bacterium]
MNNLSKYIKWILNVILYLILVTPLLISSKYIFPFITGKTMYFRILVEVAVFVYVVLSIIDKKYRPRINRLILAVIIFGAIIGFTSLVGVDAYKSFWGTIERGEGFLTISHLIIFFLILSWTFKTKKEWLNYLSGLVVIGLLVDFYALLQRAEVTKFFLFGNIIHSGEGRLSATLGNAAFLGAFTLAQFFISLLLFLQRKFVGWKIFFVLVALFNLFILYQTQTRGAALGLVFVSILLCIFYIAKSPVRIKRNIAGILLLLILVFCSVVWANRNTEWIKKSSMLERLTSISRNDITTESRLMAWDTSWKSWKDRFLFGYGWENYNIGFNKYFHAEIYIDNGSQLWFDRAHNTVFDVAVATGLVGLIAYINIFILALYYLYKNLKTDFDFSAILVALLLAHFIQNIFVFDVLSTFIILFSVLATVSCLEKTDYKENMEIERLTDNIIIKIIIICVTLVLIILSVIYFNLRPLKANEKAILGLIAGSSGNIEESVKFFNEAIAMNTYQNSEIRQKVVDIIVGHGKSKENFEYAIDLIKNNIKEHPIDVQNYLYLIMLLNKSGSLDQNNFVQAVKVGKEALKLSPTRAQIYFEMGRAEFSQLHFENGIAYFKEAVKLNPSTMESQWNLLTAYSLVVQNNNADHVKNNMEDLGCNFRDPVQLERLYNIYTMTKRYDKMVEILEKNIEQDKNIKWYTMLATVYRDMGNNIKAVETAKKAVEIDPNIKKDVDKFIENLNISSPIVE